MTFTVEVSVKGLENLELFNRRIDQEVLRDVVSEIVARELEYLMMKIRNDSSIPESFQKALFIAVIKKPGIVILGVYTKGPMKIDKFGILEYKEYKCRVRGYMGGHITPRYSGRDYLLEFWNREKDIIVKNIKDRIRAYVVGGLV